MKWKQLLYKWLILNLHQHQFFHCYSFLRLIERFTVAHTFIELTLYFYFSLCINKHRHGCVVKKFVPQPHFFHVQYHYLTSWASVFYHCHGLTKALLVNFGSLNCLKSLSPLILSVCPHMHVCKNVHWYSWSAVMHIYST